MSLTELSQLLGNFGEFVGAVAVVATLFYLSVQVRHSREATEANTQLVEQAAKQNSFQALQDFYIAGASEYQSGICSKILESIEDPEVRRQIAPIEQELADRFGLTHTEGLSYWNMVLVENKQREYDYIEYLEGRRKHHDVFGLDYIHMHPAESLVWDYFRRFKIFDQRYVDIVDSFKSAANSG
jgi:hypothetical protein